ncbi:3D domain [Syntrophomonas zehnderi OL-4]|uniref:3D domain n=1 Tax=Syntrophomonas zehnderi OL-4 TaxID=690567 RepID=A0A0E4C997_9FIRM|nr:peptidoglycan-binding protein [Syntrophomonas zehnderi]CFX91818.1 3D domain [Syntrophomonas zehnderi OL-4]
MLRSKMIVPIFVLTLFITGIFAAQSENAVAASNLYWGSRGTEVETVQKALNSQGYWCGNVDGIFGPKTYAAVTKFQKDKGLVVDGIVGPKTKAALRITDSTPSRDGSKVYRGKTVTMVATAYCPCAKCNYPYYGAPSYIGLPLKYGIIATDPKVIPMGTRLYVEGYGEGIAADQGGAIKGNRLDLCFATHQQALNFGIKTVKVTILN